MNCHRKYCDRIMCNIYVDGIGYICWECRQEFETYLLKMNLTPTTEYQIKKELKISQNWSLKKIPFTNCLIIHLNIKDYLQNVYVSMYLDSKNINYVNNFYKSNTSDNARKCSLEINKGNFFLVN